MTKTGGSSSSFGWELLDDSWKVKANNTTVFQITKSGAEVRGKITALSGKIGGFDIQSDYLSYNNQVWNGTNSRGIYIGVNGIQCGPEANGVQITPTGNLYAENGYFRGSVSAGRIDYGGDDGYLDRVRPCQSQCLRLGNRLQHHIHGLYQRRYQYIARVCGFCKRCVQWVEYSA